MRPDDPQPQDYQRPYIESGHGAQSPQAEPPILNPMPVLPPGVPIPVALPGAPLAARISQHVAGTYALGSPSER